MNTNVAILFGLVTLMLLSFMLELTALGAFLRTIAIMSVPGWIMYRWYDEVLAWVNARIFPDPTPSPDGEGVATVAPTKEEKSSGRKNRQ